MDRTYSKLNCLKKYVLNCKTEPIAARLTGKIQNAWMWSIPASDPPEILSVLSKKKYLSNSVVSEVRSFSVKKAGRLAKFSS